MRKSFSLVLLFVIFILTTNTISAYNERIGIGFSFDLRYLSKPHFILSLEGDLGDSFNYRVSKDFVGEKDIKLMVGKYLVNESGDFQCSFALGIKYIEQDDYKWLYRIEMTSQEAFEEKLFSFSSENYISRFLIENYYPDRDGTIQLHKMYWPKDENYYINYIFFDW